jgi:hypothetical protein
MIVVVRDKSYNDQSMYDVYIDAGYKYSDQIHDWIVENVKSFDVQAHGRWYLVERIEDAAAIKLRWG